MKDKLYIEARSQRKRNAKYRSQGTRLPPKQNTKMNRERKDRGRTKQNKAKQKEINESTPPSCSPGFRRSPCSSCPGRLDSNSRRPSGEARCTVPGGEVGEAATVDVDPAVVPASGAAVRSVHPVEPVQPVQPVQPAQPAAVKSAAVVAVVAAAAVGPEPEPVAPPPPVWAPLGR